MDISQFQPESNSLTDQRILISGAAAGIGRALALACGKLGATVILLDKHVAGLEAVYDEIEAAGGPQPAIYPLDLSQSGLEHYQELAKVIETQLGGLDGLVNNAGYLGAYSPFELYDIDLYLDVMAVNLHAPFLLTQSCLPLLRRADAGTIVFSTHDQLRPYAGGFGMAKAGLQAMMEILARELEGDTAIRVNAVDAGIVNTAMRRSAYPGEDWRELPTAEQVIAPYLYFLSPDSHGVTGVNYQIAQPNDLQAQNNSDA